MSQGQICTMLRTWNENWQKIMIEAVYSKCVFCGKCGRGRDNRDSEIGDYSFLEKYSIVKLQRSFPLFFQKGSAKPLNTKSTCSY